MWLVGPQLAEVKFRRYPSNKIPPALDAKVDDVYRESLAVDFSKRTEFQIEQRVARLRRSRQDLNPSVAKRLVRRHSTYSQAVSVLALYGGDVLVHLPMAANASSQWPGILGEPERQLKHHRENWRGSDWPLRHRYLWLGQVGVSRVGREMIDQSTADELNLLDVAAELGSDVFRDAQPVRTYPWFGRDRSGEGEQWLVDWASSVGLTRQTGTDKSVKPFGSRMAVFNQFAMGGTDSGTMRFNIEHKQGAEMLDGFRRQIAA